MPWTREKKIFGVTTYLETKSFKAVSKKLKKRVHVLKADMTTIKKNPLI